MLGLATNSAVSVASKLSFSSSFRLLIAWQTEFSCGPLLMHPKLKYLLFGRIISFSVWPALAKATAPERKLSLVLLVQGIFSRKNFFVVAQTYFAEMLAQRNGNITDS